VPDELTGDVFAKFEETLLVKDKGHLSTGLSGTYLMIEYLQSISRDDLIYTFASKKTFPSWGYMIENGATATWECWHGKPGRLCTMIHNCYNSIGAWFIQSLAGIRPDPQKPGFKNAIIKPAFLKELSHVNGSHDSVYGTIESHWKREGNAIIMSIKIPPNSTATVYLPAQSAQDIAVNGESLKAAKHVKFLKQDKDQTVLDVGSGSYEFFCSQR
jgi:alpha-L-rhamnosidase